jgi:hypothetical protein
VSASACDCLQGYPNMCVRYFDWVVFLFAIACLRCMVFEDN